jgi:PD-(D/E)XK nuclease superfamily
MAEPEISDEAVEQFRRLFQMLREAQHRADERAKVTHERFNVFTTLLDPHDEVRLHTRFLHCLLDPKGCHDCGHIFLDRFFDTLAENPGRDHGDNPAPLKLPSDSDSWNVERESPQGDFGRIDLLLVQKEVGFGIAIENKIYAAEGNNQIGAYADFLKNEFRTNAAMLYLTLDGRKSETSGGKPYVRISYADHIVNWLDRCLQVTYDIIPVNQVILQYRAVVRRLTGRTIEAESMKPIVKFIKQNPDIIRFRKQLVSGVEEARVVCLDELADKLRQKLPEQDQLKGYAVKPHPGNKEKRFGTEEGALILDPPLSSVLSKAPFKIWIENDPGVLIIGIVSEEFHNQSCSLANTAQNPTWIESLFESMKGRLHQAPPQGCNMIPGKIAGWPTGWMELIATDDEGLAEILSPRGESVATICKRVSDYISVLTKVYSEAIQS